jgi:hypothetical protein
MYSFCFFSCYKKAYESCLRDRTVMQSRIDSLGSETRRNTVIIEELKKSTDSLRREYIALDEYTTEFRIKYIRLPTGAVFSSEAALSKSEKYQPAGPLSQENYLCNPVRLSPWGNLDYGNCVTAEEAFAKACGNPDIFLEESVAVQWASENGVLNGAHMRDVLTKMNEVGFRSQGSTYNNGSSLVVDFRNSSQLRNAILNGPVKVALRSFQLEKAWRGNRRGWFALGFTSEPDTRMNQHCVSLCGYGTLAWLAQQFNVPVPNGVDAQAKGYAVFTWGTIGIIDERSLLAVTREAWVRSPTTVVNNSVSSFILKAMSGEAPDNIYLSHAYGSLKLRSTYPGGFGEMWICHDIGGGKIKLQARGAEAGNNYLSHAYGTLKLRSSYDGGSGEEWIVHKLPNGEIELEASGAEIGYFLSHGKSKLSLTTNRQGGEAWLNVAQY